jgi:Sulfatase
VPNYFYNVSAALASGIALSFVLERFLKPTPKVFWRRPRAAVMVHVALWLFVYAIEFLQFGRPWIAMVLTNTIYAVLIAINNVKYQTLREPFIYQDFEYFVDAVKYPRLYIPFFGWGKAIACVFMVVLGLFLLVPLEEPVAHSFGGVEYWVVLLTLLELAAIVLCVWGRRLTTLSFDPAQDIQKLGFLPTLWHYFLAERVPIKFPSAQSTLDRGSESSSSLISPNHSKCPHVITVQSESFFDIRRWLPDVKTEVLAEFDRACAESVCHGTLEVSAWGANTVRTEFSLLTGLDGNRLSVHQFNPYRSLASIELPSIVRHYKNLGYQTIAIHPYSKKFYRRDQVFPVLGFDQFLDIEYFAPSQRTGPFVSDAAVSDMIEQLLKQNQDTGGPPLFIFVITMENHGPLHLETPASQDLYSHCHRPLPEGCDDIGVYLKHLRNADVMIGRVTRALKMSTQRPGVLAWYGDHVPIMDKAYQTLGTPSRYTDYFVWSTARQDSSSANATIQATTQTIRQPLKQSLPVHKLTRAIVDVTNRL